MDESSKSQVDKIRKEYQAQIKQMTNTYELKIKNLDQNMHHYKSSNVELESELKDIRRENIDLKLEHESKLLEMENKIRDEEARKVDALLKGFEHKISMLQDNREHQNKKNDDAKRNFQETLKNYSNNLTKSDQQIVKMTEKIGTLEKDILSLNN
jgi:hypothetical protein